VKVVTALAAGALSLCANVSAQDLNIPSPTASAYWQLPFGGTAHHQNEAFFGLRADTQTLSPVDVLRRPAASLLDVQYTADGLRAVNVHGINALAVADRLDATGNGSAHPNWWLVGGIVLVGGVLFINNHQGNAKGGTYQCTVTFADVSYGFHGCGPT